MKRTVGSTCVSGFALVGLLVGCGGSRQDVLQTARSGGGEVRAYDATMDQIWPAARAALLWNHAAAIEEHRDQGYMLGSAPVTGWSWGATIGMWFEAPSDGRVLVRAVVSRTVATNVTAQSEGGLLDDVAKAVALERQGRPLPEEPQ
jgi:hypothetical protein